MKNTRTLLLFLALTGLLFSCKKDTSSSNNLTKTIKVYGIVTDESGQPVDGATVTFNGATTTTQNGLYVFNNATVPAGRQVIKASKSGFFDAMSGFEATANTSARIKLAMITRTLSGTVSTTSGGTVSNGGADVVLPASGIATSGGGSYSGTVNVYSAFYNPAASNFSSTIPGGDLVAKDATGADKSLSTYGMVRVEMEDGSGGKLQIASGNTATIKLPIAPSQLSSAPSTIALWHLNEQTGIWEEDGTATRQGNYYVGTVSHFSSWNCDHPESRGYIKGRLLDCNGNPMRSADLVMSDNSNGGAARSVNVDEQGNFQTPVPANVGFTLKVVPMGGDVSTAPVLASVNPVSAGQTTDLGNLNVACGVRVIGKLVDQNGNKVSGMVKLESLPNSMAADVWNGEFEFTLAFNKTFTLTPFCLQSGYSAGVTFTTPGSPTTIDLGNIPTCSTGSTSTADASKVFFTVNGMGYNNQLFKYDLTKTTSLSVIYSPNDTIYTMIGSGELPNNGGTMSVNALFKGIQAGSYTTNGSMDYIGQGNVVITIQKNNQTTSFSSSNGTLNITTLGGLGQVTNATFSGTYDYADQATGTSGTVTISNGSTTGVRFY